MWAMPKEDEAVMDFYHDYLPKFENPLKLSEILPQVMADNSPYVAVFLPWWSWSIAKSS